ncbi:MAG: Gfo/Idh/MocA family oxidoreductase [Bryobacteraceae bacterium]
MAELTRRHFFYGTLLAGAIPAGGFGSAPSLPSVGYKSPNEKLNCASIGAGGKAPDGIQALARMGENIVALCDPDKARAAAMFKQYEKVPQYADFRKMLDKELKTIDAVHIAVPDFMHGTMAMWCMERGKHVYVQKPLTRCVWESRQLKEAAVQYNVATQMGNQGYCEEGTRQATEMIWSGAIGDVTEAHAWTNRPIWGQGYDELPKGEPVPAFLDWDVWLGIANDHPFSTAYVPMQWRGWYDFGCGALGDMACHVLGAPNMALLLSERAPTSVESIMQTGKSKVSFPKKSTIRFNFPAYKTFPKLTLYWHDGVVGLPDEFWPAEIPVADRAEPSPAPPPAATAAARGGGRSAARPAPRPVDPYQAALDERMKPFNTGFNSGVLYKGTKGYMATGEYGGNPRLLPAARMADYQMPPQVLVRHPETFTDWVRACKGGDPAASNFNVSGPFTEWIDMACLSLRVEGPLDWDAAKMQITNNKPANDLLKPTFRKGWSWT